MRLYSTLTDPLIQELHSTSGIVQPKLITPFEKSIVYTGQYDQNMNKEKNEKRLRMKQMLSTQPRLAT